MFDSSPVSKASAAGSVPRRTSSTGTKLSKAIGTLKPLCGVDAPKTMRCADVSSSTVVAAKTSAPSTTW